MNAASFFTTRLPLALVGLSLLASPADAKPKKKKVKSACDLSYLPFVAGTTWKYQYAIPPNHTEKKGIKAKLPETFEITVKEVVAKAGKTQIILNETYREVSRTTTLTCDKKGLKVPIESFYFAGELPGALGIQIEGLSLKGEMYPGSVGLKKGESYYVDVKATLQRPASPDTTVVHPSSKLEMERQITVGGKEDVEVEHGIHNGIRVEVALSGRLSLAPTPEKSVPLPEGTAVLWFANRVGLVRAYNRLGQGWELIEMNNADGKPIEI